MMLTEYPRRQSADSSVPLAAAEAAPAQQDMEQQVSLSQLERPKNWFFPCDCLVCCPTSSVACIPNCLRKFQNLTHVILFIGSFACIGLTINALVHVIDKFRARDIRVNLGFIEDILVLLFILPCSIYFVCAVRQYDDDLVSKKSQMRAERRQLMGTYEKMFGDMDRVLMETNEKTAGFAERGFERQRYDFIRFLNREQTANSSRHDEALEQVLLPQMKLFCWNWFRTFQECSINPIDDPMELVNQAALERCVSLDELYTYCLDSLERGEVKFISDRMQVDAGDIARSRARLQLTSPFGELLEQQSLQQARGLKATLWALALDIRTNRHCIMNQMSWLSFGCTCQFEIQAHIIDNGWPKVFRLGCGCLVLLSPEHVMLLCGFLVGWVLFVLEFYTYTIDDNILASLLVAELCLWFALVRFEAIDVIQRLEREAKKLAAQQEEIRLQREQMENFWKPVQNLTDLWLYRTTPCLDVLHELQNQVEGMDNQDSIDCITAVNGKIQALFDRLGPLQDWCTDGQVSKLQKQQFGKALEVVVEQQDLSGMMLELNHCLHEVDRILPPPLRNMNSFLGNGQAPQAQTWPQSAQPAPAPPSVRKSLHSLNSFFADTPAVGP